MGAKKSRRKTKVRVAHELPKRRRIAIQEAMNAHKLEDRPDWDRSAEWGNVKFYRNTYWKNASIYDGSFKPLNYTNVEFLDKPNW